MKMKKTKSQIIKSIFLIYLLININTLYSKEPVSFITGVGSTHFEAHRMAYNTANASQMKVLQQISKKNSDGLWHVIIKVSQK